MDITSYLTMNRCFMKLHNHFMKEIAGEFQMTLMEATVVSFLYNNPGKDTAADMVELRMFSKSHVSAAVEGLMQKGYLKRREDREDRRRIHLILQPAAKPMTERIRQAQLEWSREIFGALSEEEWELYEKINEKVMERTLELTGRRKLK